MYKRAVLIWNLAAASGSSAEYRNPLDRNPPDRNPPDRNPPDCNPPDCNPLDRNPLDCRTISKKGVVILSVNSTRCREILFQSAPSNVLDT
jgi:hypothetical protein